MAYMLKVVAVIKETHWSGVVMFYRVERDGRVIGVTEKQFNGHIARGKNLPIRVLVAKRPSPGVC